MRITMIGHSTVLLEGAGTSLVTDPYFGTFGHLAYSRLRSPARGREDLRDVGGVLLSHAHWDHTDGKYLRVLDSAIPVIAPTWTSAVMKLKGARNIVPMAPWQSRTIGSAVVTAVPATHVARTIGYVIELDGVCAYFAGDTYHRPFMAEIGRRFEIDVAMMPVTTFLIPLTMGERGAVEAVRDLRPAVVIPIHGGIRPRSPLLRGRQSVEGFCRRLRAASLETEVAHLREGEHWESGRPIVGVEGPAASGPTFLEGQPIGR
jgi:L-ascorbate metabolism protein UlaG (beta-lactamase superfamily)